MSPFSVVDFDKDPTPLLVPALARNYKLLKFHIESCELHLLFKTLLEA